MAKTKITVVTPVGTFTRTTARTYTHIVVVQDYNGQQQAGPYSIEAGKTWGVLGWSGRLDLAHNVARSYLANYYNNVRIYALDGTLVWYRGVPPVVEDDSPEPSGYKPEGAVLYTGEPGSGTVSK